MGKRFLGRRKCIKGFDVEEEECNSLAEFKFTITRAFGYFLYKFEIQNRSNERKDVFKVI